MRKKNSNNQHPMATVRKTVAYANAYPETFQPGTDSYAFYEQIAAISSIESVEGNPYLYRMEYKAAIPGKGWRSLLLADS